MRLSFHSFVSSLLLMGWPFLGVACFGLRVGAFTKLWIGHAVVQVPGEFQIVLLCNNNMFQRVRF